MRKILLVFFTIFLSITLPASATHLVGGDFNLQHVNGHNYKLSLNLYFDAINGDLGAKDQNLSVTIFEKGTNKPVQNLLMPLRSETPMNYSNTFCSNVSIKTTLMYYELPLYLDPAVYHHPEGYYAVWERCCRNNIISNIINSAGAGQTFYVEFPAVVRNNATFINSSPNLPPPPSVYACTNELFTYNFGGKDPDGDELVYDLVTPINGFSSEINIAPAASPGPYPDIQWLPGYSKEKQILGDPALTIDSKTGMLSVKPLNKGLFVFSVRCQEFRNGEKIGETRIEFQLLVRDCLSNEEPAVMAKYEPGYGLPSREYKPGDILRINPTDARCLSVFITDRDKNEPVAIKAIPVNFDNDYFYFSGPTSGKVNTGPEADTLKTTLCLLNCFDSNGKIYMIDLIASDDGDGECSMPGQDTLRISFIVEPLEDTPPTITLTTPTRVFEVSEKDQIRFEIIGTDAENDLVEITAVGKDFSMASHAISYQPVASATGQATATFAWQIDCAALLNPSYQIEFAVTTNNCGIIKTATETIEVKPARIAIANNLVTAAQTLCSGNLTATLTGSLPTGGIGNYQYVWESSTLGAQSGYTIAPGTNHLQDYPPVLLTQTTWLRRKVLSGDCFEHYSEPVLITITPLIANNTITGAGEACIGTPHGFLTGAALTGGNGPYTYLWEASTTGPSGSFAPASGANTTATYQPQNLTQTTWFRRVVNAGTCLPSVSAPHEVVLYKALEGNLISGSQSLCAGEQPAALVSSTPRGGSGKYHYLWEASTTSATSGFAPAPGINNQAAYTPPPLSATTWFRRKVFSAPCQELVSKAMQILIYPIPEAPAVQAATVCPGEAARLVASTTIADARLEWFDQASGGTAINRGNEMQTRALFADQDFYVQTVSAFGCISPRTKVTASVYKPSAYAGEDVSVIAGKSTHLQAAGGGSYSWWPQEGLSDSFVANPVAKPHQTTAYTVTVVTPEGCTFTDEVTVTVLPGLRIPNAITPNGDGINEGWEIENIGLYPNCHVQIFTRWGAKIFESKGYTKLWDGTYQGKTLPAAAYYYIIELKDYNELFSGNVSIIK
ncbi:gliding motility-associated C-terminal domain-containing protein [Pontibacter qinzhouensis]|uniref:Gliding motility-associated C-terminal domain-containing protein n=1 Tax=Pontibacter qinzhouensis TaxID=2603253 RepID=A0A5C8KBL1_9BACT|nr:gliding motility-associated C-terminal domain-containing protein [Pontibacter qinzhouensis]TXK50729.1 gliding motility-associated C-terminal domain-containing protein [Pontibacter qinzhouensis]